jgi:mannonate dehydratase
VKEPLAPPPWPASGVRIRRTEVTVTAPEGIPLVVVKVETTEPDLFGLGCATFAQRPYAVVEAIEKYLAPFVEGRDPADIEDIYQASNVSGYWRAGPVLNYALAGIDLALWDIKGKLAGMPLYQLLGGRCREAAAVYGHATGRCPAEVEEDARRFMDEGYRYVRCQVAVPGLSTYGSKDMPTRAGQWDPAAYVRAVPKLFAHLRSTLGDEIELLHDVHERLSPPDAVRLARELEPFQLFFLEDPLPLEQLEHFRILRSQTVTPLAMGELLVNRAEYLPLIRERLIDFARMRVTAVGGLSVAWKIAALCDFFGVRSAWQCPGDVSPIGHAATLALDLATPNFGIQETVPFSAAAHDVFPNSPTIREGSLWPSNEPGLGIEFDEAAAQKFPPPPALANDAWTWTRLRDGTVIHP